jgi:hypothetical protein
VRQAHRAVSRFLASPAEYLLLLEDDLAFNRHLRHNLERWSPFHSRAADFAGLYNPGIREVAYNLDHHAVAVDPCGAFGNQAVVISRSLAEYAARHWDRYDLPADLRLPRLAAELSRPLYYHTPSLVQHLHTTSTWGGRGHRAIDFDPDWQANPA